MVYPPARTQYWLGAFFAFLSAFCSACKGILIKLAYPYSINRTLLLTLRMLIALSYYVVILLRSARPSS